MKFPAGVNLGLGEIALPLEDGKQIQLEAMDVLQASNPTINSALLPYGDNCLVLRAIYTFPEGKRVALSKAGGDVSSQINAHLRVGSAVAKLELITNDNSLFTDAAVNKLLEILANKL